MKERKRENKNKDIFKCVSRKIKKERYKWEN